MVTASQYILRRLVRRRIEIHGAKYRGLCTVQQLPGTEFPDVTISATAQTRDHAEILFAKQVAATISTLSEEEIEQMQLRLQQVDEQVVDQRR